MQKNYTDVDVLDNSITVRVIVNRDRVILNSIPGSISTGVVGTSDLTTPILNKDIEIRPPEVNISDYYIIPLGMTVFSTLTCVSNTLDWILGIYDGEVVLMYPTYREVGGSKTEIVTIQTLGRYIDTTQINNLINYGDIPVSRRITDTDVDNIRPVINSILNITLTAVKWNVGKLSYGYILSITTSDLSNYNVYKIVSDHIREDNTIVYHSKVNSDTIHVPLFDFVMYKDSTTVLSRTVTQAIEVSKPILSVTGDPLLSSVNPIITGTPYQASIDAGTHNSSSWTVVNDDTGLVVFEDLLSTINLTTFSPPVGLLLLSLTNYTISVIYNGQSLSSSSSSINIRTIKETYLNIWAQDSILPTGTWYHGQTTTLDGNLVMVGGNINIVTPTAVNTTTLYNTSTGTYTQLANYPLPDIRGLTLTTLKDGNILAIAGVSTLISISNCYILDMSTGIWSPTAPYPIPTRLHTATLLNDGRVYVSGGLTTAGVLMDGANIYDPTTSLWSTVRKLPRKICGHSSSILPNGNVLTVGGTRRWPNVRTLSDANVYDIVQDVHIPVSKYPLKTMLQKQTTLANGNILVSGGSSVFSNVNVVPDVNTYNPLLDSWSISQSLPVGIFGHGQSLGKDGEVYITGGFDSIGYSNLVFMYT